MDLILLFCTVAVVNLIFDQICMNNLSVYFKKNNLGGQETDIASIEFRVSG